MRGFRDAEPHAWNVVCSGSSSAPSFVVDCCDAVALRPAAACEQLLRYVPLRRLRPPLPLPAPPAGDGKKTAVAVGGAGVHTDVRAIQAVTGRSRRRTANGFSPACSCANVGEAADSAVLLEVLGKGCSGATVRRCQLGALTVAAKLSPLPRSEDAPLAASTTGRAVGLLLHELRVLSSVPPHPNVVGFFGTRRLRELEVVGRKRTGQKRFPLGRAGADIGDAAGWWQGTRC